MPRRLAVLVPLAVVAGCLVPAAYPGATGETVVDAQFSAKEVKVPYSCRQSTCTGSLKRNDPGLFDQLTATLVPGGERLEGGIVYQPYEFKGVFVFDGSGRFQGASGEGVARGRWFLKSRGTPQSKISGQFESSIFKLSTAETSDRPAARLQLRLQATVGPATGPLFDSQNWNVQNACNQPADCAFAVDTTFTPTKDRLVFGYRNARALAARKKAPHLQLKLRPGTPKVLITLPRSGRIKPKDQLTGVAVPRSRCKLTATRRNADGGRASGRAWQRTVPTDENGMYDPRQDPWGHNPDGPNGRTSAVQRYRIRAECTRDGVKQRAAVRNVKVIS